MAGISRQRRVIFLFAQIEILANIENLSNPAREPSSRLAHRSKQKWRLKKALIFILARLAGQLSNFRKALGIIDGVRFSLIPR